MINLQTEYLGLKLKNPVIVSSSGLANTPEKVKKLADSGAGAVVLKSLFEEQINHESHQHVESSDYPEAADYIINYTKQNSVEQYLDLIEESKKLVDIPVIASVNCTTSDNWIDFALKLEEAGADAIEINVFFMPNDKDKKADKYEETYFRLAENLKKLVKIPVVFKLGAYFTNPMYVTKELHYRNVDGVVLFNRFYAPDIDVDKMKMTTAEVFSSPSDIRNTVRWIGLMSGVFPNLSLSASTGVHSGKDVVKMLLSGAQTVQVCSTLYMNGVDYLKTMISDLESWMKEHNYSDVDSFRGEMSYNKIEDPTIYERSQFMKYFSNHD
jgi:dihydroorotate dehydrogenase (fumarate)